MYLCKKIGDMKVFLSWSGHKSHQVALVLRDWLPSVIQSITPYVSSEDIDKGARWSTDIAKELEDSSFGILCVTKENLEAPWLLFEAGALSKMMDKGSVCPFLFDLKMAEIKEGPILQFQTTVFEKDDIKKLLLSLNKACGESGLKEELLTKSYEVWWPSLEQSLNKVMEEKAEEKALSKRISKEDMLEEILELSRTNQKILRSPEILFPPQYVEHLFRERVGREEWIKDRRMLERTIMDLRRNITKLRDIAERSRIDKITFDEDFYMNTIRTLDNLQHQQAILDNVIHNI